MRRDSRSAVEIGRLARLDLTFCCRRGRTVLSHAYAEPPFRIGRTFDVDGALYLIIVCTGPGIFGGDDLHQLVRVERGARVLLASQAALQVHPSGHDEPARVAHEYLIEDDAELHCQWDPIIPFAGARVVQRFDLRLAGASRLYWSDALMSGRRSRGEAWAFRELAHELRLTADGSLRYLERYVLGDGSRRELLPRAVPDCAGGAHAPRAVPDYVGTSLIYHADATSEFAERVQRRLDDIERLRAGVDLVEPRLVAGRFLAETGPPFALARRAFRDAALDAVFKTPELVVRR